MKSIIIYYGNQKSESYNLEQFNKEVVSFGRQLDNDIVLDLEFVSRIHGVFFKEDGTWYVQDLDSTNGLLANGTYIDQPYAIKEGDCICIQRKDGEESISIYISESEQAKPDKVRFSKKLIIILSVICVLLAAFIVSMIIYATHRDSSKKDTATSTDASTEAEAETEPEKPTTATMTEAEMTTEEITEADTQDPSAQDQMEIGSVMSSNMETAKTVYDDIIRTYISIITSDMDYYSVRNMEYPYVSKCEHTGYCIYAQDADSLDKIGYAITDIDGDGSVELIIGGIDDPTVWDLYALENGVPVRIICSGERWQTAYCGSYYYTSGSGGAAYYLHSRYVIENSRCKAVESVYTAPETNDYSSGGLLYLHSTNDLYQVENDDLITEEEFDATINAWSSDAQAIPNLIPLSSY